MELEEYKKIFKDCLYSFEFGNSYIAMDLEYTNRDYTTLIKQKVSITEFKKKLKENFPDYNISNQNGGVYLRRKSGELLFNYFFKFNGNIFLPYYEIFLKEESFENLVNYSLTSGSSICRYLLGDNEYPMKAKLYSNIEELLYLTHNEIVFFEKFISFFESRISLV